MGAHGKRCKASIEGDRLGTLLVWAGSEVSAVLYMGHANRERGDPVRGRCVFSVLVPMQFAFPLPFVCLSICLLSPRGDCALRGRSHLSLEGVCGLQCIGADEAKQLSDLRQFGCLTHCLCEYVFVAAHVDWAKVGEAPVGRLREVCAEEGVAVVFTDISLIPVMFE